MFLKEGCHHVVVVNLFVGVRQTSTAPAEVGKDVVSGGDSHQEHFLQLHCLPETDGIRPSHYVLIPGEPCRIIVVPYWYSAVSPSVAQADRP